MTKELNTIVEMQMKTIETVFENAKNMPQTFMTLFGNPTETYKNAWMNTENAKAMYENNKRFHTAYVNYNKALTEMFEAATSNFNLISKETIKSN